MRNLFLSILFLISSCNYFDEKIGVGTLPIAQNKNQYIHFLVTNHAKLSKNYSPKLMNKYLSIAKKQLGENLLIIELGGDENESAVEKKFDYNYMIYNANRDPLSYSNENGLINSNVKNILFNLPILNEKSKPIYQLNKHGVEFTLTGINIYSESHSRKMEGVIFEDPTVTLLKLKKELKDVNILGANSVTHCQNLSQSYSFTENDFKANQLKCPENQKDPLEKMIKKLPPKLVNIVIGQGSFPSSGFIDETPVITLPKNSSFIGIFSVNIVSKSIKTYSPINMCKYFSRKSMTCTDDPDAIPASFLGKKIY